jgi:hypothetical protein
MSDETKELTPNHSISRRDEGTWKRHLQASEIPKKLREEWKTK